MMYGKLVSQVDKWHVCNKVTQADWFRSNVNENMCWYFWPTCYHI